LRTSILAAAALTATFAAAAPALAQQNSAAAAADVSADFDRDTVTVGVAGVYLPDYEGSDDYRVVPAPGALGSINGYAFTLAGNRVSVDLIRNQPGQTIDLQAGPVAVVNVNRTSRKQIDDPRIKALGERDTAIELGGYVGIGKTGVVTSPYDRIAVSLSYRYDVAGAHKSGIWQPTVTYFTPLSRKAAVGLFASAEHAEGRYARYYFGIDQAESVASGLAPYNPRGGWKNWSLGALGTYSLTGDLLGGWKAVGGINYRKMLNDYADSPVVSTAGSRSQWLGLLGVAYTF